MNSVADTPCLVRRPKLRLGFLLQTSSIMDRAEVEIWSILYTYLLQDVVLRHEPEGYCCVYKNCSEEVGFAIMV